MKRKLYLVIACILMLFGTEGCGQACDAVFISDGIEDIINEADMKLNVEDIDCNASIEVDDLVVNVKELVNYMMFNSDGSGSDNYLEIEIAVDYSGVGACKMSDIVEVAVYTNDLSYKYSLGSGSGNKDFRDVTVKNGKNTFGQYWFKTGQYTINPDNDRIFILVSDKLYELVGYKALIN